MSYLRNANAIPETLRNDTLNIFLLIKQIDQQKNVQKETFVFESISGMQVDVESCVQTAHPSEIKLHHTTENRL